MDILNYEEARLLTSTKEVPFTDGFRTEGVRVTDDTGSPALSARVLRLGAGSLFDLSF
jgi:hypothetical protein